METNGYRAVYEGGQGEIVEKKSRFIATVLPIETEEEALEFIAKMKKKYWDARHNCYAYVIGERQELQRCSDDGEPKGSPCVLTDASDLNADMITDYSSMELEYQKLWKGFFESIAIDARKNPALQNQNLPKRFRKDIVEFQ